MNTTRIQQKGFTLIEIIISIAILVLLTLVASLYLRSDNTAVYVRSAASVLSDAIRTAQSNAQTGVLVNGTVPAAFGVKIGVVSGVPTAILYADVSSPANYKYDAGEEYPTPAQSSVALDLLSISGAHSNVTIDQILVDSGVIGTVDLAFATPNATMYINGATVENQAQIILKKGTITKPVVVDRVTGRVEPKF